MKRKPFFITTIQTTKPGAFLLYNEMYNLKVESIFAITHSLLVIVPFI